jgi:predicted ATPase/DNA-binding CsgD family transcriptional regulator
MLALSGYVIDEELHENNRIRVYRGRQIQDGSPVVIKTLKEEASNPAGISRLLYEYEISRCLDVEGIVKPIRLEHERMIFALIMEDTGGISLREYMQNRRVSTESFLDIAAQLAEILGDIHQSGVIHRDLKPENILIHPGTGEVKIIDFGAAARFPQEKSIPTSPDAPVGTPQYMSPEQTGRMDRSADYRSDFYSLGVVYYELLTGRLPWQAGNSAEWLHAHITKETDMQEEVDSSVWPLLAVVLKLLSKMPEERYQSAYGLLQDLKECRRQWSQTGRLEHFPPGGLDISIHIQLPRKLYGRERETESLKAAFEIVCTGRPGIIFVSGHAGIGKTVLVQETLKPFIAGKGWFITGKFDQLRQNKPYAPFAAAFGYLARLLLTESQEVLELWKKRILRALGRNGAVITAVIPEIKWLVGAQPPVEELPPQEAQNRFLMVFRDFVRVFARKERPLVLFLDDIQWADPASLGLLQYLSRDNGLLGFLFIGAYRSNETNETHPLVDMLENMRKGEIPVQNIGLSCLGYPQVAEFLSEALHCSGERSGPLAEVLYRKSGGNPFFLCQLLKFIREEKLLYFNPKEGRWAWELSPIQNLQMENDVVGLILDKLHKLPAETREMLKIASCIGNSFDPETLSAAGGVTRTELGLLLLPAVLEGLILTAAGSGKETDKSYHGVVAEHNEFLHDRIQQAVYSMLPEEEKKKRHIEIGRLILQNIGPGKPEEKILTIMDHFNRGLDLVEDPEERLMLAGHNFTAGCKVKAAAAYDSALQYFKAGMELLPQDSWSSCRKLSHGMHIERAQCEYMSGSVETAERLFDVVSKHAETPLELADVCSLKMILYAGTGKYSQAVQTGIDALGQFGIRLTPYPGKLYFAKELMRYKWYMRGLSIEALSGLPEITDPAQRKAAELLVRLACVSSTSYTDLYGLICIMAGNHAVKCGNSEMASIGYIGYSIVEGSILGNYAAGYELGKLSIALAEKYDKSYAKCIVYFTFGAMITHWTQHGRIGLDYMNKAARYAIEAGDLLILGYALNVNLENKLITGAPLKEILQEAKKRRHDAIRLKHENLYRNMVIYGCHVAALAGLHDGSTEAAAGDPDEAAFMELIKEDKGTLVTLHFTRLQRCYLFGDYLSALAEADKMKALFDAVTGFLVTVEGIFYQSLATAAAYDELSPKDRNKYRKILASNQRQMKKWADSCKENFLHKYLLVAAEEARLFGRGQEAMSLYDRAIWSARENGYVQNEALACELAAKFYLDAGHEKIAKAYMTDACRSYASWGAGAKVNALRELYQDLLEEELKKEIKPNPADILKNVLHLSDNSSSEPESHSDTGLLRKAMRHISEEADLDKLLTGFLELAARIAGADRGCLILERDGRLFVEAERTENRQPVAAQRAVAVDKHEGLAKAVVRYVARTLETVVLSGKEQAGIFAGDAYVAQAKVKSIACLPVLLWGIPAGVLYLENSLQESVFTPERLELLQLLSAHLAAAKKLQAYLEGKPEQRNPAAIPPAEPLTAREAEVLQLIAKGMSNREIADRLGLTANTVKSHIKNIYGKLGANRRVQVAAKAKELGL